MYSPKHYQATDEELTLRIVRENQFSILVCGDQISHLPLLLDGDRLIGHMARANPQWKSFPTEALAIFQGPHGYISPAAYDEAPDNVPTWNYIAVHVRGEARVIESLDEVFSIMAKLVISNDKMWKLKRNPELEQLSRAIVAFEIRGLKFEGKLKLSQKIAPHERERVIEALDAEGRQELAEWMKLTRPTD
jgi:transcriptional regulator